MINGLTTAEQLLHLYEQEGFQVHTGWNPYHLRNWRDAQFTYLKKDNRPLNTGGGGLSWHEIPCIELISKCISPKNVLIIGNSFGWSTLLCSLVWPNANVIAMDCGVLPPKDGAQKLLGKILSSVRNENECYSVDPFYGIELTNKIASRHQLKAKAVVSTSPQDIKSIVQKYCSDKPDFIFIDGYHISPQVLLDFNGSREVASKECVYLFHDVINWHLRDAFDTCKSESCLSGDILWRTPSGMGLLFPQGINELNRVLSAYGGSESEMKLLRSSIPRWKLASLIERLLLQSPFLKKVKDIIFH